MKKLLALLTALVFCGLSLFVFVPISSSDELDDINKQIADLTKAMEMSKAATAPLESQLKSMQTQIAGIKVRVGAIEQDVVVKKKDIDVSYKKLEKQEKIFAQTVRAYYIKNYYNTPLLLLLSSNSASELTQVLAYQQASTDQDKSIITNIALSLQDLETKKKNLEDEQKRLTIAKANLDKQSTDLDKIIQGAKAYQAKLSNQISELSARQQEIINARSGTFTVTIGDSELADDYNASIKGFREAAPGGSFAIFAFGAHTHRKGMSQYGARGRAQQGQDYKAILRAYYGKEPVNKDTGGTIKVSGFGEMDFEGRYLLDIAEMPSSWHKEALKAQAVAARTYAYRFKTQGSEICTTEACQVFSSSKADNPPGEGKSGVEETRGQVLEDVVTYYASTHGGFTTTKGWDTTDGSGGGNFVDKTYDKAGGSPWVYKAWYTKGYSPSSDKCGRSNPWLSQEEMADLINAAIVISNGSDDRVSPTTTSCWGGNPYSFEELRNKGGVSSVSSVSVSQGNGTTNEVVFQTNKGEVRFSGTSFKTAFNLRAPGYLSIPQSGFAFYNIEKK